MKNKTYEIQYGVGNTILVVRITESGTGDCYWYVAKGHKLVNQTTTQLEDGCDIRVLCDNDCFTASEPIESLSHLDLEVLAFYYDEE